MSMFDKISVVRAAILEELKRRRESGDKAVLPLGPEDECHWYKPQANYFSGAGVMACPICKTGELRYSRASCNGHVHARCMAGCVAWME